MVNLRSTQENSVETPTVNRRRFGLKQLLLFILASILVHGLGLLMFALYQRSLPVTKEETESKPIEFVVVPEETEVEPPPETEKRAIENSVAEQDTEAEETVVEEQISDDIPPATTPSEESSPSPKIATPVAPPEPTPPAPEPEPVPPPEPTPPAPEPEPVPQPEPTPPAPEPEPVAQPEPTPPAPEPEPVPPPEPTSPEPEPVPPPEPEPPTPEPTTPEPEPVATRLPPEPQPEPPQTEPPPTQLEENSASSLLGGDYKKTLADGGADAFFSPEALSYKAVLSPQELELLKGFDLEGYQRRLYNKVKSNWQPSFSQKYTTWLTFNIEKNGQISQLQVVEGSGSAEFDRIAVEAVRNATPLEPLPSDFPLEHLEFRYQFYLY